MHHRLHIRTHAIHLAVDKALQIRLAPARIDRIAVKIKLHNVFGLDVTGGDTARQQKPVRSIRVPHADVAKAIHHALVVQNVVGGNQIVNEFGFVHGFLPSTQ